MAWRPCAAPEPGAYGWRDGNHDGKKETYTPPWPDVADWTPNWSGVATRVPRAHAAELIEAGRVRVAGSLATKAATQVGVDQAIVVEQADDEPVYVSRGAYKLIGALDAFDLDVTGRRCLDAGASTGGFTDVLLRRGAAHVIAVDVGYGQLAWSLRSDPRVTVMERQNVRELTFEQVGEPPSRSGGG